MEHYRPQTESKITSVKSERVETLEQEQHECPGICPHLVSDSWKMSDNQ